MFLLFYNLYLSMFRGSWEQFTLGNFSTQIQQPLNDLGTFLTSIFGDNQSMNLGDVFIIDNAFGIPKIFYLVSLVLALITSIGIVVMAVKGIKKIFSVFFYGVR